MAYSACLARKTATGHINRDVVLSDTIGDVQRLLHDHAQNGACKIHFRSALVDNDLARAGLDPDAGDRIFAFACGISSAMGIELLFETHRDSLLNDLYYTLEVLDAVPELMLTADLSHFVLEREFHLPLSARDQGLLQRIHDRSDCFQGRVASREQIQVPIAFPQHQPWVELFRSLWTRGLRSWRRRNKADATCVFLCELGPPGYAITDAQGLELSDRWQEALAIRSWVQEIWSTLERDSLPAS